MIKIQPELESSLSLYNSVVASWQREIIRYQCCGAASFYAAPAPGKNFDAAPTLF
jgi:hypothetical protein